MTSLDCPNLAKGRTLYRLAHRLRELRPHILHTHNPTPHLFGAAAARLTGVPVLIHTKHGRNYPDRIRPVLTNRFASALTDVVVPVSADAAEVASRVERVPSNKLQVIHNGIDLNRFPLATTHASASGKRVIHVARLNVVKDQTTLLRAAQLVAKAEPEFRLDIVGDGPVSEDLRDLRDNLGLSHVVTFLGYRQDVSRLLGRANLFVLSSLKEGISLTLLEAMATGLPVVATDVGGNREVVEHGSTGLLVPAQSPESLAEGMLTLLRNPELARRMGHAGRSRVEKHFTIDEMVRRYEALYLSGRQAAIPKDKGHNERMRLNTCCNSEATFEQIATCGSLLRQ